MSAIDAPATVAACAQSIRELGEMMQVADDYPDWRGRMLELERLTNRLDVRMTQLKDLLCDEMLDAMGGDVSRRRDGRL